MCNIAKEGNERYDISSYTMYIYQFFFLLQFIKNCWIYVLFKTHEDSAGEK